jgi:hypothetical protein
LRSHSNINLSQALNRPVASPARASAVPLPAFSAQAFAASLADAAESQALALLPEEAYVVAAVRLVEESAFAERVGSGSAQADLLPDGCSVVPLPGVQPDVRSVLAAQPADSARGDYSPVDSALWIAADSVEPEEPWRVVHSQQADWLDDSLADLLGADLPAAQQPVEVVQERVALVAARSADSPVEFQVDCPGGPQSA